MGISKESFWAYRYTNCWEGPRRTRSSATPPVSIRNGIWSWALRRQNCFSPWGPEHGLEGLNRLEELVADTRETIGDEVELMLDGWTAYDSEFTVRVAERMRPYNLKWLEDYIQPEDLLGYESIRQRLPWQTLATGEHWYNLAPFAAAAGKRLVDIFQPDVLWCGGITAAAKICHLAQANNISVIAHGGMNTPFGQHFVDGYASRHMGRTL